MSLRTRGALIVDDDVKVNKVIADTLTEEGIPTRCVGTTREGLLAIAVKHPAVLIVDLLGMFDPTPVEMAKDVRTNPATSDIPILVITGADEADARTAIADIKAVGNALIPVEYLGKPFKIPTLLETLKRLSLFD